MSLAPATHRAQRMSVIATMKGGQQVGTPLLTVTDLSKSFDGKEGPVKAVGRISFSVLENEFVSVVGPSGCGKTTLLRCIAGLMRPSTGNVRLRGKDIAGTPRNMAVVFQDYARSLLPWLTVRKNVLLPLRNRAEILDKPAAMREALDAVGLARFAEHYPWQLSGGMQQRVAIARALAYQPTVLLLDEPMASVDAQTRADLEDLILEVRRRFRMTVLLVTHDIDESVYMSDRVVVLTAAPSTVKQTLAIDLPSPRSQVHTKAMADFSTLRTEVYLAIRSNEPTADIALAEHGVSTLDTR
jgi:NitT/TauT family transport system ATP-binding protein